MYSLTFGGRDRRRDQSEVLVPVADDDVGETGHGRMDGMLAESRAEDRVVGSRWHTAHRVARVDVLHVDSDPSGRHLFPDPVAQVKADVVRDLVPRLIDARDSEHISARAFRDRNDRGVTAVELRFERVE